IRAVEADGSSRPELADAFVRDMTYQSRRLVCAITVPHPARLRRLLADIERQAARARDLGRPLGLPLLVPVDGTPRRLTGEYIAWLRQRTNDADAGLHDYLGALTLSASRPSLEAADATDDGIECQIWLHSEVPVGLDQPQWRVRIALTLEGGPTIKSSPVRPSARIDRRGKRRWDTVHVRVPLA